MRIGRGADKRVAELTRRAGAAPGLQSEGAPTHGARPRASERLHEVPGAATLVQTASVGVPGAGARRRGLAVHGAQGFSSWRRRDWPHNGGRAELCA